MNDTGRKSVGTWEICQNHLTWVINHRKHQSSFSLTSVILGKKCKHGVTTYAGVLGDLRSAGSPSRDFVMSWVRT